MYKFDGNLINDSKGVMSISTPSADVVGGMLKRILTSADNLAELYDAMIQPYSGENEFYSMLADVSEKFDNIDLEEIGMIRNAYTFGSIYSAADRWIISAMYSFDADADSSDSYISKAMFSNTIVKKLREIIDDCEFVPMDKMGAIAASLYHVISVLYMEIYNTYDVSRWIIHKQDGQSFINDITVGYNEFLIQMNMSPEEMADMLYEKLQKFVFVTNEVDKDPEVSKKIREMVPGIYKEKFEELIELITEEQVQDILNGTLKIDKRFFNSLAEDEFDDDFEDEE